MCGIFAYVGMQNSVDLSIQALKKLEYRGYDSAGIAGLKNGKLFFCKEVGKVSEMEKKVKEQKLDLDIAIAHTRWATHGKPSEQNAHPHYDSNETLAVVHNGIIENFESIRNRLIEKGIHFHSETDTEVIAQLLAENYKGDILKAVQATLPELQGSFALALIHKDFPNQVIVAAQESPLAIGVGNGETFIASDTHAFLLHTRKVIFLGNSEVAVVKSDSVQVFDVTTTQIMKQIQILEGDAREVEKGDFEHFMLKEIFEQPQTVKNALLSRYVEEEGSAFFEELEEHKDILRNAERIVMIGCGTSWHAGCIAAGIIEEHARIPVAVEVASELRYKNPIVPKNTIAIAISQSGETADTLAAVKEYQEKGAFVIGLCNVHGSTLVREAQSSVILRAGAEIGVASTKAFTSQLVVLTLLSLYFARMRDMGKVQGKIFIDALKQLPQMVQKVLDQEKYIESVAKRYSHFDNFFYLGRRYMYPCALEGALKLKEIAYINAVGYPSGELKHGPIALVSENFPSVALCANKHTYDKLLSNLREVQARSGPILAVAFEGAQGIKTIADDILWVPDTIDELAPILSSVALQIFEYYVAKERGAEIDQPRNLAKSVTVE